MKIVFMGTPDFARDSLEAIYNAGHDILAVVTNVDKPKGRGMKMIATPVKEFAIEKNLPVFQPEKVKKNEEFINEIKSLNPDIICVVAYGKILPKEILDIPQYGCINVHASLLPKLRGGAPIHKAIINGYDKTGITIMYMDKGMDTGDMISKVEVDIDDCDTAETLHNKLMNVSVPLLKETLVSIINGTNKREKQNDKDASFAYNISREEEHVLFDKTSKEIYNQIRGLNSWPGAYASLDGNNVKLWSSKICENKYDKKPGTIVNIDKNGMEVVTKDKSILITELQMPGKKKVNIKDFVNGIKKEDYIGKIFV